jgi:hypothetical protein
MQLDCRNQFMIYTDTNYGTRYRYLCSVVHRIKICFMLHAHKFKMKRMWVERKWIDMHENKKIRFKCLISFINIRSLQQPYI